MINEARTRKSICYVGFYSDEAVSYEKRYSAPSAVNKMNYIASSLIRVGHNVRILSPSWSKTKKFAYYSGRTTSSKDGIRVKYPSTFSSPGRVLEFFSRYYSLLWLFIMLIFNAHKETHVVLYHSTFLYFPILCAKKICRFTLILEVEEIYHLFTKSIKEREDRMLSMADGYLFANKGIKKYLTKEKDKKKPFIVVNGEYNIKKETKIKSKDDQFIKVVFAGNIEHVRRGAFNAVSCAKYLSDKYRVYIIGFGAERDISVLNKKIKQVNDLLGYKKCEYFGVKHGAEYDQFLFDCDIAINPQELNKRYMQFAFPSKILSYLNHNLRTVTTQLETISDSEFSDLVIMVPNPSPQKFAEAIMKVNLLEPFDPVSRINKADLTFLDNLKLLVV